MEDCYTDTFCIRVCSHTLPSSSQLQGLEDSNILLEDKDVWSCQTPNPNLSEKEGADGFSQPFTKSLLRNVLVDDALLLLVSQSLGEDSPLICVVGVKEPPKVVHLVGRRIVQTGCNLYPSCDRSRWSKYSIKCVIITGHKHFIGSPCKPSRHVRSCLTMET